MDALARLPKRVRQESKPAPQLKTNARNWLHPILLIGIIFLLVAFAAFFALTSPVFASIASNFNTPAPGQEILWASVDIAKPAIASIEIGVFAAPLADSPATPSSDAIPSIPATEAPIVTDENTETPGTMLMEIVTEDSVSQSVPLDETQTQYSAGGSAERWIDVDLTQQRVDAYEGETVVNSFTVSTGLPQTPTVTGTFSIWIKVRIQDMFGPGYYLPDVPYVMYFYEDYGLHGTYWHNNFGTPMSRGCVNLTIDDAAWLFNWASVGTVVNVHY